MREIVMFGGVKTQVDDEDYERASEITWHADHYDSGIVYARCRHRQASGKYKNISLHRFIMGFPSGKIVDHIDGDGLNNQRTNLRICTQAQNGRNVRKHSDGKQRFKGVHPYGKRFEAYITFNRTRYYLGIWDTDEQAAAGYNAAAVEFFGEYVHLNRGVSVTATPPDGVPTFSEFIKRNMPGFTLVGSKVPGEKEVEYGRQHDRNEGNGRLEDEGPLPVQEKEEGRPAAGA